MNRINYYLFLFEYLKVIKLDIPSSDYTPGKALNLGVREASRERVLIMSAHCQLESFDHKLIDQKFCLEEVACIFGKQTPYYLGKEILIEALILSKCQGFLHAKTNVSEFVKFLDDKKKIKYFNLDNGNNSSNEFIAKWLWYYKNTFPTFLGGFK